MAAILILSEIQLLIWGCSGLYIATRRNKMDCFQHCTLTGCPQYKMHSSCFHFLLLFLSRSHVSSPLCLVFPPALSVVCGLCSPIPSLLAFHFPFTSHALSPVAPLLLHILHSPNPSCPLLLFFSPCPCGVSATLCCLLPVPPPQVCSDIKSSKHTQGSYIHYFQTEWSSPIREIL